MIMNIKPILLIRVPEDYDFDTFEAINEAFQDELSESYHVICISSIEVSEVQLELHDVNVTNNLN